MYQYLKHPKRSMLLRKVIKEAGVQQTILFTLVLIRVESVDSKRTDQQRSRLFNSRLFNINYYHILEITHLHWLI